MSTFTKVAPTAPTPEVPADDGAKKEGKAPPPRRPKAGLATIVSGSVSGALASALLQPFDVIRTRMQSAAAAGSPMTSAQASSTVWREGGLASLWRGTQATVVRLSLGAGLHFFCLETIRAAMESEQPDGTRRLSNMAAMASGGLSRALASAILCPVTVVKTRMENATGRGEYRNVVHALTTVARAEGAKGLFRGLVPTVLTTAPFSAFYYLFYTRLREKMAEKGMNPTVVNATSSTVAAVGATLLTQPMDVVRTRMQLARPTGGAGGLGGKASLGLNVVRSLRELVQREGLASLTVGVAPRFLKRTTQSALVWTLYEEMLPRLVALGGIQQGVIGGPPLS